jgi:hypothetical protein
MITKTFPAFHKEFYDQFEIWRKEMLDNNQPEGGIYVLHTNKEIGRLLKVDVTGILYIGKGVILPYHNRIGKFVNSLNNKEAAHDGGSRFNTELIKKNFPLEDAEIVITLTESPEQLEADLLHKYYTEFGELPPFNRRLESI